MASVVANPGCRTVGTVRPSDRPHRPRAECLCGAGFGWCRTVGTVGTVAFLKKGVRMWGEEIGKGVGKLGKRPSPPSPPSPPTPRKAKSPTRRGFQLEASGDGWGAPLDGYRPHRPHLARSGATSPLPSGGTVTTVTTQAGRGFQPLPQSVTHPSQTVTPSHPQGLNTCSLLTGKTHGDKQRPEQREAFPG